MPRAWEPNVGRVQRLLVRVVYATVLAAFYAMQLDLVDDPACCFVSPYRLQSYASYAVNQLPPVLPVLVPESSLRFNIFARG